LIKHFLLLILNGFSVKSVVNNHLKLKLEMVIVLTVLSKDLVRKTRAKLYLKDIKALEILITWMELHML
jgi:hypothetical protein